MGSKSGGGGGMQTVTQKTELPGWVQDAGQRNLAKAYEVSANLLGPYEGPRYAGITQGAQGNIAALQNNVGSTNPAYALAQNTTANAANYEPGMVQPNFLSQTDLNPYMNPYTDSVVNYGLRALDTQRQQALNGIGDQAIRNRAFGGSRQGVMEGMTNAGAALNAGNLASQLMSQNFSQAQANATGDINRAMAAQQANQAAGLQGGNLRINAANQLGSLAGQGQEAFLSGSRAALAGQGMIQGDQQAQYDAARQAFMEAQQFPLQQLQIPLMALGQTPYGQTVTTTGPAQQQPSSSGLMQGLGAASSGIGLLGGIGSMAAAPGMSSMAGLMSLLPFSDETEKTDIKKVGKDQETGVTMYAYRYKGDPKTYPKVIGPMAQEIAEKYPDQVHKVGGKLAVNLGFPSMRKAFN